jgi:hypothetical protein
MLSTTIEIEAVEEVEEEQMWYVNLIQASDIIFKNLEMISPRKNLLLYSIVLTIFRTFAYQSFLLLKFVSIKDDLIFSISEIVSVQ